MSTIAMISVIRKEVSWLVPPANSRIVDFRNDFIPSMLQSDSAYPNWCALKKAQNLKMTRSSHCEQCLAESNN